MFTDTELAELAEMVCGRVNALSDMLVNGSTDMPESSRRECRKALRELASLDTKLRPHYRGQT